MTSHATRRLRTTLWVLLGLLVAVFGFGPKHHVVVCTGQCAKIAAANTKAAEPGCECCRKQHADKRPENPRGPKHGAPRPPCCIDLCCDVELGPLPTAKTVALAAPPVAIAPAVPWLPPLREPFAARAWPHDTGPPRLDPRTALLASTTLLL